MENKKNIKIIKSIIRIIIIFVLVIIFNGVVYHVIPQYDEEDMYAVSGVCIDIRIETYPARRGSGTRKYIVMDNGEKYRIHTNLIDYMDLDEIHNLKGQHLDFYAADKKITFNDKHTMVALNTGPSVKEETLRMTNKSNLIDRVGVWCFSLIIGLICSAPSIMRITEIRDKEQEKIWAEQKRAKKKLKYQQLAEKNSQNANTYNVRPKNMSRKRWKRTKSCNSKKN